MLSTTGPHSAVESAQFSTSVRHRTHLGIGYSERPKWYEDRRSLGWKNSRALAREEPPENAHVAGDSCTSVHNAFPQVDAGSYRRAQMHLARYRQYSTFAIHSSDNDLWKTLLLQFFSAFSRFPSLPLALSLRRLTKGSVAHASCQLPQAAGTTRGRAANGAPGGPRRRRTMGRILVVAVGRLLRPMHARAGRSRVVQTCRRSRHGHER
jgi:hypothetical protein